jgi:hypothetical protein
MTGASTDPTIESFEKPLSGAAKLGLIVSAALAILLFYLFAAGAIVLLLLLLAGEFVGAAVLVRFGMTRLLTPFIERHSGLLLLFVRSFWLRKGVEVRVPVAEADAPALFVLLRQLSKRIEVAAPRQVVIEMSTGAWVQLGGIRRGAKATTLGLGYDLLAWRELAPSPPRLPP